MPQTNDDLFQDSRMTFGEHLEELRSTLVKALLSLAIGVLASLYFTPSVVQFLQTPVERAIRQFRISKARIELEKQYGFVPDEQAFLLSEYNLVPQEVRINPADMLKMLQAFRPELFPEPIDDIEFTGLHVPLPTLPQIARGLLGNPSASPGNEKNENVSSPNNESSLTPGSTEIASPAALAALARRLTDAESAALQGVSRKAPEALDLADQAAVVATLNRLIQLPDLYEDPAFALYFAEPTPNFLTQFWNSFWQIEEESLNGLNKIKETFEENKDARLRKRLQRTLLERLVMPPSAGSQYQPLTIWEPAQASTVALGSGEAFMIYLKASLLTGTIVAGPFIFYFLWTFVAAGLYPQEQRYVYFYLPFSLLLFGAGVMVAFVFAFEPVLKFLFSFNMLLGIDPQPRIGEWLSFVMLLPLGFGVAFQLPLVMLLLYRIGIISVDTYVSQWRVAILIIAVISMLATPADPISMLLLGGPLILLYVFGIALCRFLPTNRRPFPEGYDPVQ